MNPMGVLGSPTSPGRRPADVGVLAKAAPAPPTASHVGGDPFIRVLSEASMLPDSTEVKVYLEPTTGTLRNLTMQMEPPPTLGLALAAPPPAAVTGPRVMLPMLSPGGAATVNASVTCTAPLGAEAALLGQLSYADAAAITEPRVISFRIPVSMRTLLRPHRITTPEFGQMWAQHSAEKKATAASPFASNPAAFMASIESKLYLFPVQTIGMECIACGKLVGGSGLTVLLHGKLGLMAGRAIELTLRSRDPRLTDALQRAASEVLTS